MNLENYRERKRLLEEASKTRNLCVTCMQPEFGCYCAHIQPFDPGIKFAILIHPMEFKRRIATGRMSHLSLKNSELITGQDYSSDKRVNDLLGNPEFQPMVLYPGRDSINLTEACEVLRAELIQKKPLIFVIDGTWATARKTMHLSRNLKSLPKISFTPPGRSQFRVRKQPGVECYSTIEAIHHTIELLGPSCGFDLAKGEHDSLMRVFNGMVERQLECVRAAYADRKADAYRRVRSAAQT